jgi:hypothetical protein
VQIRPVGHHYVLDLDMGAVFQVFDVGLGCLDNALLDLVEPSTDPARRGMTELPSVEPLIEQLVDLFQTSVLENEIVNSESTRIGAG